MTKLQESNLHEGNMSTPSLKAENQPSLLEDLLVYKLRSTRVCEPGDSREEPVVWYHMPIHVCQTIMDEYSYLVRHGKPSPYLEASGTPKCNVFLNDVLVKSDIPVPWDHKNPPDVHGINLALAEDPRYEKVWSRSSCQKDWESERDRFLGSFKPHDSDILIWDNTDVKRIGIAEETTDGAGHAYYADRDSATGLGHCPLSNFINSSVKGYGAPDAIYSYKYLFR